MPIDINNILKNKNSIIWLGFFLLFIFATHNSFAGGNDTVQNKLTVLRINVAANKAYAEVSFSQSQRIYKVLKRYKQYSSYINLLKWSEKYHVPVLIKRRSEYSDTICSVKKIKT